ncbi:Iron-sulfur cluster-binding protein [hydrothermal vent metagenome]|uniref:Iron-sulfur cluster-binding protein n=1 Tax=hydrothermal vent metagenome TaxID=652676 RepID=A0A3B1D974_9ZZZZ
MSFPQMIRLRQHFDAPQVADVPYEVEQQLSVLQMQKKVNVGETVAITVGSRGIANIPVIIKSICNHFKRIKAKPFIVPAMGSHGGGTTDGQLAILKDYGITEETMQVPVRATMQTEIVGKTPQGIPVHIDQYACQADHVFICNRVKPHTAFVGEIESGLHKMMLIGLGKHTGATLYHRATVDYSFQEIAESVSQVVIKKCGVLGGLAIVENAYDETGVIAAVAPDDFLSREKELLVQAESMMPQLPFSQCDLLIVDRIGKNISGTGLDTTIVGRKYNDRVATKKDKASCKRIFVRGLTEETHGNASGIGIVEVTNKRTVDAIDYKKTHINCLTAGHLTGAAIPMWFHTDEEAIAAILHCNGLTEPTNAKVIQISDTRHLAEVSVSRVYENEIETRNDLEIIAEPTEMNFDSNHNLCSLMS